MVKNPPDKAEAAGNTGSIPGSGRSSGEGNGNPFQYPCLENPMVRGAWQASVHGVAKNRTQLSAHRHIRARAHAHTHTHTHTHTQIILAYLLSCTVSRAVRGALAATSSVTGNRSSVFASLIVIHKNEFKRTKPSASFGSTYTKIGTIQRRLAWPLCKDDTQIREVFHIFKKDHEKILEEIIVETFPKMGKEIITQVQETQRVPNRINPRRNTPRHILIKLTKIKQKEQILKAAREKQITHKGILIGITADLSAETLQARREWQDILKVMKENNLQPRLLYPAKISFKYEGEIKSFTDKQKLREFSTTNPALQQMLKDIL